MTQHRWSWIILSTVICLVVAPYAAAEPTNVRMQNVIRNFVTTSGQEVIGLGSWISGRKYADVLTGGASDHDLRLLSKGSSPAELQREWMRARATLTDLVKKEFGKDADKVLKSINLYPPSQLMSGVEDAADALSRFKRIGNVPNLGFTGAVADAPAQFAEGLYGQGSKVWTQGYEQTAGRLFYTRDGKVFMGFTDLTHMSEGIAKYDVPGMCNTANQWADHIIEEMHEGRGDKVAKYLERLDRDLAKAKSLAKVDLDPAWRAQVKRLAETLKKNPEKAGELREEIGAILARSRGEASVLNQMTKATSAERKVLQQALKELRGGGRFSKILGKAGEVVTLDRVMTAITLILHVRQTAKYAGEEEYHQAVSTAFAAAVGMASFPVGLVADMTNWVIESAKTSGYDFAASTQEAWDLMAGIYTAVGRTDVDEHGYTLEDLVAKIDEEEKLRAVVYAKAMLAASRDAGEVTGATDRKVGEAIFNRCFPIILEAWRARREELAIEYTTIMDELEHAPVLLEYTPSPASVKPKEKVTVTVSAELAHPNFMDRLARAKAILVILHKNGAFADVEWKWAKGREGADKTRRIFDYETAGVFPVTVTVKVNAGAANAKVGEVMARKFELKSGIDVRIDEAQLEFNAKYLHFNILLQAPSVVAASDPYSRNWAEEVSGASTAGMQLIADDVPFVLTGNTFTADFLDKGDFGAANPTRVHVEGVFNDARSMVEKLTVTWAAERNDPKKQEVEKWSFTARGIALARHSTSGRRGEFFEFDVDADAPADRPAGFQLVAADFLKTSVSHHIHCEEDCTVEIPYQVTWREDGFQSAAAEVSINFTFKEKPDKNPPIPPDVPR